MTRTALPLPHPFGLNSGNVASIHLPADDDPLGWCACFASFTMLFFISWSATRPGQWVTTIVVLLFLAPWAWVVLRQSGDAIRGLILNWGLLALPLATVVSVVWSEYPSASLKEGSEYLLTTFVGIWAASCIKPRVLMSALLSSLTVVAVLSVLVGSGGQDPVSGEYILVGIFSSKNYFAVCMSYLLLTAVTVSIDKAQSPSFRMLGVVATCLAVPLLLYARSVGALVISIVTLLATFFFRIVVRLHPKSRVAILTLVLLGIALILIVATFSVNYADALAFLGKDVSLTGRTLLWQYAEASIRQHPVLGLGYQGFWQSGNSAAIQLWFYSHVGNMYGYQFHNAFLEVAVDLGFVGLAIFVATLLVIACRIVARLYNGRPTTEQMFAIALFIFILLRMPIEVDLFFPFQIAPILLCVVWGYLKPMPAPIWRVGTLRG